MTRLLSLLALVLLLAACGGTSTPGSQGRDPSSASSSPTGSASGSDAQRPDQTGRSDKGGQQAQPVPEALQFSATTVQGEPFDGASVAGRPVLFWFWAPWCPTCRGQIPQVEGVAAEHPDLAVIGVGSLDSADAIAGFAAEVGGVTHLEDVDGVLWRRFGITEQSSYVLLDAQGEVAFETGYGGSEDLGAQVDDVLG